jgi:predicted GTPase
LWGSITQAHKAANRKMSTPVLTRLLLEAVQFQSPKRAGMFRPKLRYAHQGGMNPPVIVIHGNSLEHVTDAYKRFLEGRFPQGVQPGRHAAAHRDEDLAQPVCRQGKTAIQTAPAGS